jgi:Flp pilus assembly protein TadG
MKERHMLKNERVGAIGCRGQAIVELAIVLVLLLMLVLGIFEFGRYMYIKNTLTHAARAGSRAAVVTAGINGTTGNSATVNQACSYGAGGNNVVFSAACNSLYPGVRKPNVIISVTGPAAPKSGDMITVSVKWNDYSTLVPTFIPQLNHVDIIGQTAMRYE